MQTKNTRFFLYVGLLVVVVVAAYLIVRYAIPSTSADPLKLSLEVPGDITVGQDAVFKLHVKNISRQTVEFDLGGQPPHGFVISDSNGTEVWNSREARIIQDILGHQKLGAGKEVVFETIINKDSWDPLPNIFPNLPLPKTPGTYFIQGELYRGQNDPVLKSPTQEIEIR